MAETTDDLASHYIDQIGWGKYQWYIFQQCFLSYMSFQSLVITPSYYASDLENEWGISNKEKGIMSTMFQLGCIVGSYLWGSLSDHYGRTFAMKIDSIVIVFSCFIIIFSENYIGLTILLFFFGFGVIGHLALISVTFKEFCPTENLNLMPRLNLGAPSGGVIFCLAAVLIEIFNSQYIENWKMIAIINFFCNLIISILKIDMDETPGFLVVHKKYSKAEEILKKIQTYNGKDGLIPINLQYDCEMNENGIPSQPKSHIKMLFSKTFVRSTIFFCLVFFTTSFATVSVVMFMPEYLSQFPVILSWIIIAIQNLAGFPCLFFAPYLVNSKLGRKYTLVYCQIIMSLAVILFAFIKQPILIIIITSVLMGVNTLSYASLFLFAVESYPIEVENTAQGVFLASSGVGSLTGPLLAGVVLDWKNGHEISLVFFGMVFLICASCSFMLKETRQNTQK
ncbi:unnamed protein product [Blepharisma stoltei]|uniref:Major facilitator superfamily (MFS) profile domain-containing protein n=1 Tax=Blepharisma stoltei TaxID=1481888 RepID=A0AAU9J1V8_9CILI|nr:unnamed protein product [Blepharisma stoltei]